MKKKLFISTVLLCLVVFNLHAQEIRLHTPPGYNYLYTPDNIPKGSEGSPYLDDWKLADIKLKNHKTISGVMLRYSVYSDQMLYQENNVAYTIGAPDSISEILLSNKVFIYREYQKAKKTKKGFFELVLDGKVSLLNKYEIELIRANYNVALNSGNKNDRLILEQQLYLQLDNQIVPLDKKDVLFEILQDKNKAVKDYMNKEKLSIKKQQDVIKILTYYNQLQ